VRRVSHARARLMLFPIGGLLGVGLGSGRWARGLWVG